MPGIIGKFSPVFSTVPPLDAHIGHLRHLTNQKIAKEILQNRHKLSTPQANKTSKLFSAHIAQALKFHYESRSAKADIRPVLQYYSYLNLSVATILAFRPKDYNQYRRHGVQDKTHSLSKFDLSSEVLVIKRGAVPLFHSILSDVPLYNRKFRLGQLAAGFHMCSHELNTQFNKKTHSYFVNDEIKEENNNWFSIFYFTEYVDEKWKSVPRKRIEDAIPLLKTDYSYDNSDGKRTAYISNNSWSRHSTAEKNHCTNGIKIVNYGGHNITIDRHTGVISTEYIWHGVSRTNLMPTLSSILLMSFSLASIVRYRPILLESAMSSPIALVIDTFTSEADSIFIPSLRNLLYREELAISPPDYI